MTRWINARIEKASWLSFAIWFLVLFGFSSWAFSSDSPWTRALEAGGGLLPETQIGFPPIEPQRSIDLLGEATSDYILWQAIDIPYAVMNLMVISIALALGLRAMRLDGSPLKYLLAIPVIYFVCEFIENGFVALFALGFLAPSEPFVLVQQLATTVKLTSGIGGMALGLLGIVAALLVGAWRLIKK